MNLTMTEVYRALLSHPMDLWRAKHQWLYAAVRDAVAEESGLTAEEVQNTYEAEAFARRMEADDGRA